MTFKREGVAYSDDGAMLVTLASGSTIDSPTFTGISTFPNGSASAPSIVGVDADTGLFWRAAPVGVGFAINGAAIAGATANTAEFQLVSGSPLTWSSTSAFGASSDTSISRAGPNSIQYGIGGVLTTTARTCLNDSTTGIANAVATSVVTFTIPNGAHSASARVKVKGSLGAGGAIGANEASATNTYDVIITRTAGVNAAVAISSAYGAAASAVAGAATVTCTAALSAVSGAVGATNTVDVQVTISRSGGSSTNHTCFTYVELLNDNASGVTVA